MGKCTHCEYFSGYNDFRYCNYLSVMGRLRSLICPPGEQCTVFEPRTGKRRPQDWVGNVFKKNGRGKYGLEI